VLDTSGGALLQRAPVAYQEVGGARCPVASRYTLAGDRVGFALGAYDAGKPVVIDPMLSYSTYLGGGYTDAGYGIAVDGAGDAYVLGQTNSAYFPTAGSIQGPNQGAPNTSSLTYDAFVTKLNPAGNALVYSSFLGGANSDYGYGIAADGAGNAYVAGTTLSANFPVTNAYQSAFGGGTGGDAFVARIDTTQSGAASLRYGTYLGGATYDDGLAIAADPSGNGAVYVTGDTAGGFPTKGTIQGAYGGGTYDAYVAKLDTGASGAASLLYGGYLGGGSTDVGQGIADGTVVDRYTYDAWGEQVGRYAEGVQQQLRYRGYWYDSELGWYWLGMRHYDPEELRYLQPDPSDLDGVHTYAYGNGDPVDELDLAALFTCPSGRIAHDWGWIRVSLPGSGKALHAACEELDHLLRPHGVAGAWTPSRGPSTSWSATTSTPRSPARIPRRGRWRSPCSCST